MNSEFSRLNNYPWVVFHGFAGFGDQEKATKYCPYFGFFSTNIPKLFERCGTEMHTPSMSGFTSMWDRACEAYAQIVGGRVDYGKVHSEKYGHARYGRTYEAMVPDWGQLDEEGKIKKINVIGHSFGGPTVRFFVNMMMEGSKEEVEGTDPDDLSEFFKGGHKGWIHSCTTLASANDGISFLYAIEKPAPYIAQALVAFLAGLGSIPFAEWYDPQMEQWGLGLPPEERKYRKFHLDFKNAKRYYYSDDCVLKDLYVHTQRERTKDWKTYDDIYYFAYSACRTAPDANGNWRPDKKLVFFMKPTAVIVGKYPGNPEDKDHAAIDESWKQNDGLVNTHSSRAPERERWEPWHGEQDIKPGIWYDMPTEEKDHMSYCGVGESKADYAVFFYDILRRIDNLPAIDE
ncbi:MAG: hypothetical protein II742_01585 [Clostridia bacterium]|nr:hypothetical protein [Clostridia bacterium]